jgi:hypothetical protein
MKKIIENNKYIFQTCYTYLIRTYIHAHMYICTFAHILMITLGPRSVSVNFLKILHYVKPKIVPRQVCIYTLK